MAQVGDFPEMTPKAAAGFADFVGMGPGRSLRKLHERYRQQTASKPPAVRLETLFEWSTKYAWQDRLANAVTALTEQRLEQAAEIDSGSFFKTSELIAQTLDYTTHHHLDAILKMRESVRKPSPKQAAVNVNINLIVKELADKYGLTDDERAALFEDLQADLVKSKASV